jgi:hypothetical protein
MSFEEILGSPIGVHARHDEKAVFMRSLRQFTEQISSVQKLRAMVQRELAWVIRDDASGVDDNGLHVCALPVLAPPADVVSNGILFRDVGLAPPVGAPVPGQRGALGRGRSGGSPGSRGQERTARNRRSGVHHCTCITVVMQGRVRRSHARSQRVPAPERGRSGLCGAHSDSQ